MRSELPEGWTIEKLENMTVKVGSGATPRGGQSSYKTNGIPLIRSMNIHFGEFRVDGLAFIDESQAEKLKSVSVIGGDVLLNITGASIGRVTSAPLAMTGARVNQHVAIIRPNDGLGGRFLELFLASPSLQKKIGSEEAGMTRQALTKTKILDFQIPIPPINEQRRIVAKIEALQDCSRRGREALEAVPPLLEKFRQSVLAAAFRGDLTADWRAQNPDVEPASELLERIRVERRRRWEEAELAKMEARGKVPKNDKWKAKYEEPGLPEKVLFPSVPTSWVESKIDALIEGFESGRNLKAQGRPAEDDEFGVLKISAVTWGEFAPLENKALERGDSPKPHEIVRDGDLLISRANTAELVGAVVQAPKDYPKLMLPDKILRIRLLKEEINPRFIMYALRARPVRGYFEEGATGTSFSMRNLSQPKIRNAQVPIPPVKEQDRIAGLLDQVSQKLRSLSSLTEFLLSRLDQADQSILDKAFRGELVPQDPNDEPAEELLRRVQAQRQTRSTDKLRDVSRKKAKMAKVSLKSVEKAIAQMPSDVFSFEDFWNTIDSDYETLKTHLFKLLGMEDPKIIQFFDESSESMKLRKAKA